MSDLLSEYKKLNNSFDREYIFHVGADAGFYSEVSNMVSAILYCLKYGYRFKMYSKTGNFAYEKGWTDFFEPFCDETTFYLHHRYNARYTAPRIRSKHKLIWGLYRGWNKKTFLTYTNFGISFSVKNLMMNTLTFQNWVSKAICVKLLQQLQI